jgi:hypothetical protein
MNTKPSVSEFIAFQWILAMTQSCDAANDEEVKYLSRRERRALGKAWGRDLSEQRTDEQILLDLSSGGEGCTPEQAHRILKGIPKKKWAGYLHGHHQGTKEDLRLGLIASDTPKKLASLNKMAAQWIRWFSGKRYGIVVDSDISAAIQEVDIDLSGLNVELPWSPMLIKTEAGEHFLWQENGLAYFTEFRVQAGQMMTTPSGLTKAAQQVEYDKTALALWICSVAKGEGKESYFELKVGNATIALLPRINATTLVLKHKIAVEAETDKGSWVRKGHFRVTKKGPIWMPGVHYKEDLPYVQKVHPLEKKGMLPKSQELFRR